MPVSTTPKVTPVVIGCCVQRRYFLGMCMRSTKCFLWSTTLLACLCTKPFFVSVSTKSSTSYSENTFFACSKEWFSRYSMSSFPVSSTSA